MTRQTRELSVKPAPIMDDYSFPTGKFYVGKPDGGLGIYLRNDGKLFGNMQSSPLDLNGGTYFLTQQEAQDCLDKYNAAKDDSHQDTQT